MACYCLHIAICLAEHVFTVLRIIIRSNFCLLINNFYHAIVLMLGILTGAF